MRPIDAEPIEQALFKQADKSLAKNPYENARICAFRQALELILGAPAITPPPNDPLTLGELREMDGEKIFVHYIDGLYTDEDGAYFGKFEQLVRECNGKLTACELPLEYYGKTWLAYRRKPEEAAP